MATRRVIGSWKVSRPNGVRAPGRGTVTFTPSAVLSDALSKEIVVQDPIVATLSEQGEIDVQLQATDESSLKPNDWYWDVQERITGLTARRYKLDLPASFDPYDLSSVDSTRIGG